MKKVLLFLILTFNYFRISAQVSFSEVTFYGKPRWYVGKLGMAVVNVHFGEKRLKVRENRKKTVTLAPGYSDFTVSFPFSLRKNNKETLSIDVKPNTKYLVYVKSVGFFKPKPTIKLISEQVIRPY